MTNTPDRGIENRGVKFSETTEQRENEKPEIGDNKSLSKFCCCLTRDTPNRVKYQKGQPKPVTR